LGQTLVERGGGKIKKVRLKSTALF